MNKEDKLKDYHQKLFIQFFYQEFVAC